MIRTRVERLCTVALTGLISFAASADVTSEELTDFHLRAAISTIVDEFYSRKHPDRFWEPQRPPRGQSTRQGGGYTALVTLALLYAGESFENPKLIDAIEFLLNYEMQGTYAVALRTSVFARLPERYRGRLKQDVEWLLRGFSAKSNGWDYVQNPDTSYEDNSIRQFVALALWDAARRDVAISRTFWNRIEHAFLSTQQETGGWNYRNDDPTTGSMTAAGMATLFITQDLLHAETAVKIRTRDQAPHEIAIARGLDWMNNHFSPSHNPGRNTHFCYYMYGVERVGLAGGYRTFGGHDWFREGAAEILNRIGKWNKDESNFELKRKIRTDDLAFALLFLSRGRVPVIMNKLEFAGAWNNRPRDVANLTDWIRRDFEMELNWQIVSIEEDPDTWLNTPVLYIASHEPLPWINQHDPQLAKLKHYIDRGGMIFAVNEGPARNFSKSVESAARVMYPKYEWRDLPEDHWVYNIHFEMNSRRPQLSALSNGVRELIILSERGDLSRVFQVRDVRNPQLHEVAANAYFYASEFNRPHPRLYTALPLDDKQSDGDFTIIRAIHSCNWNPEPIAFPSFAAWLKLEHDINMHVRDVPLMSLSHTELKPDLVIVSGIDSHSFAPEEISVIKNFVTSGNTILFETPGGNGTFTESVESTLTELFAQPITSLANSHIITGEGIENAYDCSEIDYRRFTVRKLGIGETAPRVRAIMIDNQPRLLFSREDISHALLDQPCWGINGYSTDSARKLLKNIVMSAKEFTAETQRMNKE